MQNNSVICCMQQIAELSFEKESDFFPIIKKTYIDRNDFIYEKMGIGL